ncbi:MAG: hypothetical protein R2788_18750 [Saprospiraceae bacterium]
MKYLLVNLLVSFSIIAAAQDSSIVVTKNFQFKDGIYLSFEEFQMNSPTYLIDEIFIHSFTNPQTFLTQVDSVFHIKEKKEIDPEKIWAICMDGVPFLKIPKKEVHKELPSFAALKLRGKICYFTYPDYRIKKVPVAAYNPLTGRPYLRGEVERDEKVVIEKMFHFETGEIVDFNVDNFLKWIQEDRHLVETIERTPIEEVREKLFRLLLIYVDRHETKIKMKNDE